MHIIDFILFPFYVLLFFIIFARRRKRITDPILKKYQLRGFWIKVFGTFAFTIFHTIVSPGNDSTGLYYDEGINIARLITSDSSYIKLLFSSGTDFDQSLLSTPFNTGYFLSEGNYFVCKLVAVFSFISFGNYMVINLFFSMISFSGVWRLYKFFYELYPNLHKKLALAILYLPTFVFWSSGILKDPLAIGMMGWLTYAMYYMLYKKVGILKNLLIALLSGYLLFILKSYILFAYLPFFLLFIVIANFRLIKTRRLKLTAIIAMAVIGVAVFFIVADKLQSELGNLALDRLSETVKAQQNKFITLADAAESSFSLGVTFDGSNLSLIKMAPAAIIATFYRPYLWESKKISSLLSSLESLILMIFTLYVLLKGRIINCIRLIFGDPVILFCFCFAIVFGVFVGATALNFGTLVRYKIPCMPFYVIALVLINERIKQQKNIALALKKAGERKEENIRKG